MESILIIFVIFALGVFVGWELRERAAKRFVDKFVEENFKELEKQVDDSSVSIKIEKHGEMFYVFGDKDDCFMGQGKDRQELEDSLAKNYPGKRFYATPANLKEMGFTK